MKNKTIIHSILHQHCPSCRSENMFLKPTYSRGFNKMNVRCPNCGQTLAPEPGFYTGSMYVSYAFQVAIILTVFVATNVLAIDDSLEWYLGWIVGIVIVLFPFVYRLSRSAWAHLFIPFRGSTLIEAKE